MDKIMNVINDIWAIGLVRFIVFIVIGFVLGLVASILVTKLLSLLKLDKKLEKLGVNEGPVGTSMSLIGKLVFLIVFLMFLPQALGALGITNATGPINGFVSAFVGYLPKIVAAAILLYVGIFLAQIIGQRIAVQRNRGLLRVVKLHPILLVTQHQIAVIGHHLGDHKGRGFFNHLGYANILPCFGRIGAWLTWAFGIGSAGAEQRQQHGGDAKKYQNSFHGIVTFHEKIR